VLLYEVEMVDHFLFLLFILIPKYICNFLQSHICLFSGWLREFHGPGFLEVVAPNLVSRKVCVSCAMLKHLSSLLHFLFYGESF
jgi:hypothetical protein